MSALQPPPLDTARAVAQDSSESDHFSSASEGSHSPIPTTRVERVDDSARHGEVPGTPAYDLRVQDAVPDEIEVVPEGRQSRSRSNTATSPNRGRGLSSASAGGSDSRAQTPGGTPIPKTVVEKVDFEPSYGEVEGTPAKDMRMADALPDEVTLAPVKAGQSFEGSDERGEVDDDGDEDDGEEEGGWLRSSWQQSAENMNAMMRDIDQGDDDDDPEDDDFGDDFDEFAEGAEDEDFGDFDEPQPQPQEEQKPQTSIPPAPDILAGLPPLDLTSCTTFDEIQEAIAPYIDAILPTTTRVPIAHKKSSSVSSIPPLDSSALNPFPSERSLSLWQQLVSPPPMQPPNWTKSRIRRLFLVSLGVPVDLDEILPPRKMKRLVLPSLGLEGEDAEGEGAGARPSAVERLREGDGDNESTTSLDSKGVKKPSTSKPRKSKSSRPGTATGAKPGAPAPPDFDTNAATLLCSTTETAMLLYTDEELAEHVRVLLGLNEKASKVLEFWLERKDEGLKEKEALEGVIENLVGFVKGTRGR